MRARTISASAAIAINLLSTVDSILQTRSSKVTAPSGWPDADAVSLGSSGSSTSSGKASCSTATRSIARPPSASAAHISAAYFHGPSSASMLPAADAPQPRARRRSSRPTEQGLRYTLPAWIYQNEEFHELENEHVFLPGWQIVCHASELAKTGDYVTFEFFGPRGFVVRDEDGTLSAFTTLPAPGACRGCGRARQLPEGDHAAITTAGATTSTAATAASAHPIRFQNSIARGSGSSPSSWRLSWAWCSSASAAASRAWRSACSRTVRSSRTTAWSRWCRSTICGSGTLDIDWKNVVENYVEDYHFPLGHPRSRGADGAAIRAPSVAGGTMRLSHRMREEPLKSGARSTTASSCPYRASSASTCAAAGRTSGCGRTCSSTSIRNGWISFNSMPAGPGRTRIRARSYGFPDDRREMRAARYLFTRLNSRVQAEDEVLTRSVQRGLGSGGYTQGILSDKEVVLAGFQDWLRARLPVGPLDPSAACAAQSRRATRRCPRRKCRPSDSAQIPLVVAIRDFRVKSIAFFTAARAVQLVITLAEISRQHRPGIECVERGIPARR